MRPDSDPPIVGIGASAGGVKALQTFFEALPDEPNAAFVVVVHLDPEFRSQLANILSSRTSMPVAQVEGTEKLENNHVYVIAPNSRLVIADHTISAFPFDEPRYQRAPIDLFFRSLAEQHTDGLAYAVVLTGAGADGAIGVKSIKESGGREVGVPPPKKIVSRTGRPRLAPASPISRRRAAWHTCCKRPPLSPRCARMRRR